MKAAMYYGKEDIRIEEIQEPQVRSGIVKIVPAFNDICGSDVHFFHEGPMAQAPSFNGPHPLSGDMLPIILGHELSGIVQVVGEGVQDIAAGDHVVVEPLMVDGTCPAGLKGKHNLCE